MSGFIAYDFGDAIRSGCNSAEEDERDLDKVYFRDDLFKSFAGGYLATINNIDKAEIDILALSCVLMTYECGMRFLTDYLNGDKYFRISRQEQNLDRARNQFKLVLEMEEKLDDMKKCIEVNASK
jgi:hypothetical protein